MPFLLLDDAADEATRRLQDFGQQQLQQIQQGAQAAAQNAQSAGQSLGASAQDATQRLMSFGQQSLSSSLSSLPQPQLPDVDTITGRLHAFGDQAMQDATNATQGAQSLLRPQPQQQGLQQLNQPPANQGGQIQQGQTLTFGDNGTPGAIDSSSPQAFARSIAPYAQYAAQALGIDPTWVAAMAASESNYGKAQGNELFGVKALPGQKGTTMMTHEGEYGGTQQNATFAAYDTPLDAVNAWVDLIKNHYPGAVGAQDLGTFVHGLKQGGYFTAAEPEYKGILQSISDNIGGTVQSTLGGAGAAVQGAKNTAQGALGQVSQFGQQGLSDAEAYAACGPAAAVRFAEMYGRNPTLQEATQLAAQVGWTPQSGMAGLSSEGALFDKMNIPHRTVGADWNALATEASSGNPVVISTPGHYFTADAYDPSTGAFHVGQSGKDLRQGSEWMTPAQMEGVMGKLQGGLAVDNPNVSTPSPLSSPPTDSSSSGNLIDVAKNAAQQGVTALDRSGLLQNPIAQQVGQNIVKPLLGMPNTSDTGLTSSNTADVLNQGIKPLTSRVADSLDQLAGQQDTIAPGGGGLVPSDLMRAGASFLRSPGVLDSMKTLQDLNAKYGTMDSSTYNPQDQQAANQALTAVGGVVGGAGDASRMYHGTSAAFEAPAPGRFDTEGLYGPGYYLTSDPRVAGGIVAQGGEQVGPSWLTSGVRRPEGAVIQPGYAGVAPKFTSADIGQRADAVAGLQRILGDEPLTPDGQTYIQNMLDQAKARLAEVAGPNVRAVDVPQNLNLFDADARVTPDVANAVADRLIQSGPWRNETLDSPEVAERIREWTQGTGNDLYTELAQETGSKGEANQTLAQVGFDGIQHEGGQRVPMTDENGLPIQHQVNIIFPDSLNKITNAVSGTQGGAVSAPFALGTAGAALSAATLGTALTNPDSNRIMDTLGLGDWSRGGDFPTPGWQSPVSLDDALGAVHDKLDDIRGQLGQFTAPLTSDAQDAAQNPIVQEVARNIIGPMLGMPNSPLSSTFGGGGVLDAMDTIQQLKDKYTDTPGAQTIPMKGQDPLTLAVDPSDMTADDAQRYQQAQAMIGGITMPTMPSMGGASALDLLQAARIGSLAGGIPTLGHIALNAPIQAGLKLLNDVPASVLKGNPEEIPYELYGAVQGLRSWATHIGTTLSTPGPLAQKMAAGGPVTAGQHATEIGLTGLVKLHPVLQDMANLMAQHMDLWKNAASTATDNGFSRFSPAWQAEVQRLVGSPTADMVQSMQAAGERAGLKTPLGTTSKAISDLLQKAPLAKAAVPIFDIGARIASQGLELAPMTGPLGTMWDVARAAAGKGPYSGPQGFAGRGAAGAVTPLWQRVRNNMIGLGLAAAGYMGASQGLITGEGPADPQAQSDLRDLGVQQDATKIGDRYFNNHLLGPVGWALSQGANAYESSHARDAAGQPQTPQEIFEDLLARQGRYFENETFLNSLAQVHDLIGSSAAQANTASSRLASGLESLIPQGALLSNIASITDPYQRAPQRGDIAQAIESRLPGLRESLPTRLSGTAQGLPNPQQGLGIVLPRSSLINTDPILTAFASVGNTVANAPTSISLGGGRIDLTPDEQRAYQIAKGQQLVKLVSPVLEQKTYQDASDGLKSARLQALESAANAWAQAQVLKTIAPSDRRERITYTRGPQSNPQSFLPQGFETDLTSSLRDRLDALRAAGVST